MHAGSSRAATALHAFSSNPQPSVNRYSTPRQSIPVESNISGCRRKKRYVRKSIFAMYPQVALPFFNHNSSPLDPRSGDSRQPMRMAAMRCRAASLQNYRLTLTHKTPTSPSSFHLRQPRELQRMNQDPLGPHVGKAQRIQKTAIAALMRRKLFQPTSSQFTRGS